jgi:hypothetical protein
MTRIAVLIGIVAGHAPEAGEAAFTGNPPIPEHHVHRLVVVEPDAGRPIGIRSTTDLVPAIAAGRRG